MRRTLQAAIDLGAEGLILQCNKCFNLKRFSPAQALKRFRGDLLFSEIAERARCRCGAKASKAVADWPRRSRGGSEPQPIIPKDWGRLP